MEWSSHTVRTNNINLHVSRGGSGSPVILLHGVTDSGLCWERVATVLATDYDVIMPDARGHGHSDKPDSGYTYVDHAADVAGLVAALDLETPLIVIGHSMGAGTAATVAARYPHLTRAIVLEDPPWLADQPTPADQSEQRKQWMEIAQARRSMSVAELIAQKRDESPDWDQSELPAWAEAKKRVSLGVFHETTSMRVAWQEAADAIQCAYLLITADPERGGIVTPEIGAQINQRLNAQVVRIDGAGHSIRRDQFERYVEVVTAFLRRVRS